MFTRAPHVPKLHNLALGVVLAQESREHFTDAKLQGEPAKQATDQLDEKSKPTSSTQP